MWALTRDPGTVRVLSAYRRIRERIGEAETPDFEAALVERAAIEASASPEAVRAIVAEWIDRRPLPYLKACRYPFVRALFTGLRRAGKQSWRAVGLPGPCQARRDGLGG